MALSTTPRTWSAGETVTAAEMNTEVRDNMNALGAGVIPAAPTATGSAGTASSAATETYDAVMGNYVFTALAGHRYAAILDGMAVQTSVANDIYRINIRNGGASTPTATSTTVASTQVNCPTTTSAGAQGAQMQGPFVPGAGTVTLGVFTKRLNGSGTGTPIATGVNRALYVVDLGTV